MTPSSKLVQWQVIEIWDTEVPADVLRALSREANRNDTPCFIPKIEWGDLLILHGTEGYCLTEETLEVAETWLEKLRSYHDLAEDEAFRIKIGRA